MTQAVSPPVFTSNKTLLCVADKEFTVRVLKMDGSTLLFVSNQKPENFDEMAIAMKMPGEKNEVVTTTVLGNQMSINSYRLAEKLCKRFQRQFIVSFNAELDRISESQVEKALVEYINNNKEQFT